MQVTSNCSKVDGTHWHCDVGKRGVCGGVCVAGVEAHARKNADAKCKVNIFFELIFSIYKTNEKEKKVYRRYTTFFIISTQFNFGLLHPLALPSMWIASLFVTRTFIGLRCTWPNHFNRFPHFIFDRC